MKIELLILLVFTLHVNMSSGNALTDAVPDPCGNWQQHETHDADLGTWDIIDYLHLDNYEMHHETITQIVGSNSYQTAYRFERESNLTLRANDVFPFGTPFQFSFECTYRQRQPQNNPWHIFHLTNQYQESQLSVTLNPTSETLTLSLPDSEGELQTVEFRHSKLFDDRWHKIMLGVTDNRAKLWVDCSPVKSVDGYIDSPLRQRGDYDINEGFLSIAQNVESRRGYEETTPIDIQWLVMTCDPTRPLRQSCQEIPGYDSAGTGPAYAEGAAPCQVCPPGVNGTKGERGLMGLPGEKGDRGERGLRGYDGVPGVDGIMGIPGAKGERGERGLPGLPATSSSSNVVYRDGPRGEKGEQGIMGPPGPPGHASLSGGGYVPQYIVSGGSGMQGESGSPGPRGNPGPPGMPGAAGRSVSDEDVRDICYAVLREQLTELTAGLQGPQGAPGPQGRPGKVGREGPEGPPGMKGSSGSRGLQGMPGLPGPHGPQGIQGERGERGERGDKGDQGESRIGPIGPQGPPGSPGVGERGDRGPQGSKGEQGREGPIGPRGQQGRDGQCPNDCYQAMTQANALYAQRVQGNQKGP